VIIRVITPNVKPPGEFCNASCAICRHAGSEWDTHVFRDFTCKFARNRMVCADLVPQWNTHPQFCFQIRNQNCLRSLSSSEA
jgi:hypothetical protein